jgi:hypothetical protein
MKFHTLSRRAAAAGAASALVAGAMVGITSTAAQAAPVTNTYTCQGTSPFPVTMSGGSATLDALPGAQAGMDVPANLLQDLELTFTVPDEVLGLMATLGIDRVDVPDFTASMGTRTIPVDNLGGAVEDMIDNGNGSHSFVALGMNKPFEVPAAGIYDVLSPRTFTIDAYQAGATTPVISVPCSIQSGTTPGVWREDLPIAKNDSTTKATAPKKAVKKGKAAAISVKVAAANETPSGKVVLKKGKKAIASGKLNAKGAVVLKVKKGLKVGKNKLVAFYNGDGYTNKSKSKAVTVKVKR